MSELIVEKINEVHVRVYSPDFGIECELADFFTYEYPGARFTPQYKARLWDGKVRMYDQIRKTLYVGLVEYMEKFAEKNGYTVTYKDDVKPHTSISYDQVKDFADSLEVCSRGKRIDVYDYQIEAVHLSLADLRKVLVSPTGSGKSLIIYLICRWYLEHGLKCIVVVPTTSLVEQMYSDFEDYSTENGWSAEDHCQKLYSGFPRDFQRDILFTTWQSIYKLSLIHI